MLAVPACADCPENIIWAGCWDLVGENTTLPGASYGPYGPTAWKAGQPCELGCYDLVSGVLVATGRADPYGECTSEVMVHDDYQVVGPAGPPFAFAAVFSVDSIIEGNGIVLGGLAQQWINPGDQQFSRTTTGSDQATLALVHGPGEAFPVWALLEASGSTPQATLKATGVLRFQGLPAGYSIASCQHYDVPVPAAPTTWGRLKTRYR